MKKDTEFRTWLRQLWTENCSERDGFGQLPYTQREYFQRYKWWLKREFQHQRKS